MTQNSLTTSDAIDDTTSSMSNALDRALDYLDTITNTDAVVCDCAIEVAPGRYAWRETQGGPYYIQYAGVIAKLPEYLDEDSVNGYSNWRGICQDGWYR
jgi:hypothetical protein